MPQAVGTVHNLVMRVDDDHLKFLRSLVSIDLNLDLMTTFKESSQMTYMGTVFYAGTVPHNLKSALAEGTRIEVKSHEPVDKITSQGTVTFPILEVAAAHDAMAGLTLHIQDPRSACAIDGTAERTAFIASNGGLGGTSPCVSCKCKKAAPAP